MPKKLPLTTQASSKVCFRTMFMLPTQEGLRTFGVMARVRLFHRSWLRNHEKVWLVWLVWLVSLPLKMSMDFCASRSNHAMR